MAKLHEVKCLISGITLGIGLSKEEAQLNAEHGETNKLIIEGGDFKQEFTVTDLAIRKPTFIRIVTLDKSITRIDGFRTINVGIYGDKHDCEAVAKELIKALTLIELTTAKVAAILPVLGIFNPTVIHDLEDAPDSLIAAEYQIENKEPTPEELKSIADALAGPNHEVGPVADLSGPPLAVGDTITAVGTTLKVTENGLEKVAESERDQP